MVDITKLNTMNNPNRQLKSTEIRTHDESLIDDQRILSIEAPATSLYTESDTDKQAYDDTLSDIINSGSVKQVYWDLCQQTVLADNAQPIGSETGIFDDPRFPAASYASAIAGNRPHPQQFINSMSTIFANTVTSPSPQVIEAFQKDTKDLALAIYGDRYTDYVEQQQDLMTANPNLTNSEAEAYNRAIDREILGKSGAFRLRVRNFATELANDMARNIAENRNALATPRDRYLQYRKEAAERKHKKLQEKANTALLFKGFRQWRLEGHGKALQKYTDRYEKHHSAMTERADKAMRLVERNNKAKQLSLEYLVERKKTKLVNREARRLILNAEQHGYTLSPEQTERIARAAGIEEIATRQFAKIKGSYEKAQGQAGRAENAAAELSRKSSLVERSLKTLHHKAHRAQGGVVYLEAGLSDIETQLSTVVAGTPEHDDLLADKANIVTKLEQRKKALSLLEKEAARLTKQQDRYQAKLDSLVVSRDEHQHKAESLRDTYDTLRAKRALSKLALQRTLGKTDYRQGNKKEGGTI